MNEFVLNGLVKRRASVTRAPKPRKINEQKNRAAGASLGPPNLRHSRYAAPELIAPHSHTNSAFVYKRWGRIGPEIAATVSEMPRGSAASASRMTRASWISCFVSPMSCAVARSEVATLLQIAPDLPHARPRRAGQN
jgi:hypothetical protein